MQIVYKQVEDLVPYARNSKTHPEEQISQIMASIKEFGFLNPLLIDANNNVICGHGRLIASKRLKMDEVPCIQAENLSEAQRRAFVIIENRLQESGGANWDKEMLRLELRDLDLNFPSIDMESMGFSDAELAELDIDLTDEDGAGSGGGDGSAAPARPAGNLADRFGIPPFSVFNAREGWWQQRKNAWIALGIKSEVGRGDNGGEATGDAKETGGLLMKSWTSHPSFYRQKSEIEKKLGRTLTTEEFIAEHFVPPSGDAYSSGTSIFDPVLAELLYRWFCPAGGQVLDPFAGGSVRGVVAAKLGRRYWGGELRAEQVEANRAQWEQIRGRPAPALRTLKPDFQPGMTPIERRGPYWVKRDDTYAVAGVSGGKVRSCWALAQGAPGLVTAGSRASPQVNIVAHIARRLGVPCRVHTPTGDLSPEVQEAQAMGAEVIQHPAGYNNVIVARAREDAAEHGWVDIPFGMECQEAVEQTRRQVAAIPADVQRIVMPVGSGMSLCGVLWGLRDAGLSIPVLGVQVGADPVKRLKKYAPPGWEDMVTLVPSGIDYHDRAPELELHGLTLDPIYEAKCLPFLEAGDMLWVVGIRASEEPAPDRPEECPDPVWFCGDSAHIDTSFTGEADFVFSCPPYGDLEVYSDDPADLSTLPYPKFVAAYREIIARACSRLKPNSFAAFVVGEIRDKSGNYLNFVADTINAFRDAGLHYYNEAILVTAIGSLPIRAGRQFDATRKFGKTHQNVLVFAKGDGKKAAAAMGPCEFGAVEGVAEESK